MITKQQLLIGSDSAYRQALKSYDEGGIPIGSALMLNDAVVALGHNQRLQKNSNIHHGEMNCIENAGHAVDFRRTVLFTTLSPCRMCANAILLFRIPSIVILDDENTHDFATCEELLRGEGVEVVINKHSEVIDLNRVFQREQRSIWLGDVGDA